MKNKLLYEKFRFWIAREINSLDTTASLLPQLPRNEISRMVPTVFALQVYNTIVITAGQGSITENEAPANAPKHPCLPSSYPGAIIVFTYYHAFISLLRTSEML